MTGNGRPSGTHSRSRTRSAGAATVCFLLVAAALMGASVAAVPAAGVDTASSATGPSFVVDLAEDGSAAVTLTLTYDLETDDERTAFRTLQNDSETRDDARDRFRSRMAAVASDASNATGRDMAVSDATIDLSVSDDGNVGVVVLGVTWSNLATTEDGALVVTEPFASGFEPDREFTVRGPDGYERTGASPSPDTTEPNAATWDAGSDLAGFEVTFERAASDDGGSDGGNDDGGWGVGAPGFGATVALLAVAVAALALGRRR